MLSARCSEISQKADAPFIAAGAGHGLFVRTREATTLTAVVKEDGIEKGLDALFTETDRVARFGFTATELTRQKQLLQRAFERAVAEKDQQESRSFAEEFIRNFTTDEPIPGIVYESQLHQRFLPEITLAEINKLARSWASDKNRVVVVNAPERPGLAVPDATKLASVIKAASAKNLTAYVDAVTSAPLVETPPTPERSQRPPPKRRTASRSGSCRTASRSSSSRRRSKTTSWCFARSAPAARRSRAMRTTLRHRPRCRS
jgi:zinc protease